MKPVEHRHEADIAAPPRDVFAILADVDRYDGWLDTVSRIEPEPGADAWLVTLKARLGPLARSKRLRVIRSIVEEPTRIRIERAEHDGRDHSAWIFDSTLAKGSSGEQTSLVMTLTYGGQLWTSTLSGVLDRQLRAATRELEALAAARH